MFVRLPAGSILTLIVAAALSLGVWWLLWFYAEGGPIYLVPVALTALPMLVYGRLRRTAAQVAVWAGACCTLQVCFALVW